MITFTREILTLPQQRFIDGILPIQRTANPIQIGGPGGVAMYKVGTDSPDVTYHRLADSEFHFTITTYPNLNAGTFIINTDNGQVHSNKTLPVGTIFSEIKTTEDKHPEITFYPKKIYPQDQELLSNLPATSQELVSEGWPSVQITASSIQYFIGKSTRPALADSVNLLHTTDHLTQPPTTHTVHSENGRNIYACQRIIYQGNDPKLPAFVIMASGIKYQSPQSTNMLSKNSLAGTISEATLLAQPFVNFITPDSIQSQILKN